MTHLLAEMVQENRHLIAALEEENRLLEAQINLLQEVVAIQASPLEAEHKALSALAQSN